MDPNTIQGQNQPITFHLQPMEDQPGATGPVRDIRDTIQGFPAPAPGQQQAWHQVSRDSKSCPSAMTMIFEHVSQFRHLCACLPLCLIRFLNVNAPVGAFNQEKALVGAFSVISKSSRTFV